MNTQAISLVGRVPGGPIHTQYAALCYRVVAGAVQALLITTRGSGRWIVPKGWPMPGRSAAETAAREAWEEAGVIGYASDRCLGAWGYSKGTGDTSRPCAALVFPVAVLTVAEDYPECGQRRRRWLPVDAAAQRVDDRDLAAILTEFEPPVLGQRRRGT